MANTILNAAEYQIEGGLSLKPGNYLAKITDMEIETTENGKRVNFEFVANKCTGLTTVINFKSGHNHAINHKKTGASSMML